MSSETDSGDLLVLFEQDGFTVARVLRAALNADALAVVSSRLQELLAGATRGLIVDCRDLPSGAVEQMGPLLYELVGAAHRRAPRTDVCAVGEADQSTGDGKTLLMPPRFETVEAAGEALGERRQGKIPVRLAAGQSSSEALPALTPQNTWLQSTVGQMVLAILVIGLTSWLVAYSAIASFTSPVVPRRRSSDATTLVAIVGNVRVMAGRTLQDDASAVVLAWPAYAPVAKYHLSAEQLFGSQPPPTQPALAVTRTAAGGRFSLSRSELTGAPGADYHLLAISQQHRRGGPPADADLKRLATYFESPQLLLGDRQYLLELVATSSDGTREQVFVLAGSAEPATAAPAAPPAVAGQSPESPAARPVPATLNCE